MASTKGFEFVLQFTPKFDAAKVAAIAATLKQQLGNLNVGDLKLDASKIQNVVNTLQKELDGLDLDALQKEVDALQKEFDKIDLTKIDEQIGKLGDVDLNFELDNDALKKLASSFAAAKEETEQLLATQKNALAALKVTGKEGTEAFTALEQEIEATEKQLKTLGKAADDGLGDIDEKIPKLGDRFNSFNEVSQGLQNIAGAMNDVVQVGSQFESTLKAVQAVTGGTNELMEDLGGRARDLALQFGGSASDQLKSFQGVLSKFGAQVAEQPAALAAMANSINTLSVAGGIDATNSMNALTDTMLQFGLVTGDAEKDAQTMAKTADALAASAQVGAAEIPQVAESILQVGVAAKGAKLSMEQTTAAIQVLAVGGKTGAEAGVGLRNVLGLIQKASGPAEESMKKLGTSSKELGELLTTKGLDAALAKIKGGMDNLGTAAEKNVALMDIFGAENSSVAGILLDNVDKFKEFQDGISNAVAEGATNAASATAQAAVQLNTAEKIMSRAKAQVEDIFISVFNTVGSGTAAALGSVSQLTPLLTNLAGVKQILPPEVWKGAIDKAQEFGSQLGKFSGLEKLVTTVKPQITELGGQFAKLGPLLSNPMVIGAGIGIAALTYFFAETEEGQKIFEELKETAVDVFEFFEPLVKNTGEVLTGVLAVVFELGKLFVTIFVEQLSAAAEIVGALFSIFTGGFDDVKGSSAAMDSVVAAVGKFAEYLKFAAQALGGFSDNIKIFRAGLVAFVTGGQDILAAFAEFAAVALNPANWFDGDLDKAKAKLTAAVEKTVGAAVEGAKAKIAGANLGENLAEAAKLKGDLDKAKSLDALVEKFGKAKSAIEKQSIAEQIKKQAPDAVKALGTVVDANGKLVTQYEVLGNKVKAAGTAQTQALGGKLKESQSEVVKGLEEQAKGYDALAAKQKAIQDEISAAVKSGRDTTELKKKYEEAGKAVEDEAKKMAENVSKAAEIGVEVKNLKISGAFKEKFDKQIEEMERKAAEAKIGEALAEAAQIKGNLDQQDAVGDLVSKYNNAASEIEKNFWGKKIAALMPEVVKETVKGVDANGKVIKSFEVSTQAAEKNIEANKRRFGGELRAKQTEFVDALQKEGASYQENLKKAQQLAQEIQRKKSLGVDTTDLEKKLSETQKNILTNQQKVLLASVEYKKMGLEGAAAIRDVAKALNVSEAEAKKLIETQSGVTAQAKLSAAEMANLATSYKSLVDGINKALGDAKGAVNALGQEREAKTKQLIEQEKELQTLQSKQRTGKANEQELERLETVKAEVKTLKERLAVIKEDAKTSQATALEQAKLADNERVRNARTERATLVGYANRQQTFNLAKQELETKQQNLQLALKENLVQQQRAETDADKVVLASEQLILEKEKLTQFEKQFIVQRKNTKAYQEFLAAVRQGDLRKALQIAPTIKATPQEKEQILNEAKTIVQSIQNLESQALEIRLKAKLDVDALQRARLELKKADLQLDFNASIKGEDLAKTAEILVRNEQSIQNELTEARKEGTTKRVELLEAELLAAQQAYSNLSGAITPKIQEINDVLSKEYALIARENERSLLQIAKRQTELQRLIEAETRKGNKQAADDLQALLNIELAAYEKQSQDFLSRYQAVENERLQIAGGFLKKYSDELGAGLREQLNKNSTGLIIGSQQYVDELTATQQQFAKAVETLNAAFDSQKNAFEVRAAELRTAIANERIKLQAELLAATNNNNKGEQNRIDLRVQALDREEKRVLTQLKSNQQDFIKAQSSTLKSLTDQQLSIIKESSDKQIAALQAQADFQARVLERALTSFSSGRSNVLQKALQERNAVLDKELNKEKARLDAQSEYYSQFQLDSFKADLEEEARKKREEAEKKHQQEMLFIEAAAQGQRLAQTALAEERRLEILRDAKAREIQALEAAGDPDSQRKADSLKIELEGLEKTLGERTTVLFALAENLQTGLTDTLSNLFAGDLEAAKKPFKDLMGVIAGVLTKQATALVTKLVLDDLLKIPAGGFASLLLVPVITAGVNAGVQRILAPAISGLLSFSTGGSVDEPTLAIIGDAAKQGRPNKEWVMNDANLKDFAAMAAQNNGVREEIAALRADIQGLQLSTRLRGEDIYVSLEQTKAKEARRTREV